MPPIHSDLPIIAPDPPRKTASEKYGSLYYLGIAGLIVLIGLLTWFGWGIWTLRGVFHGVYVLHDRNRPETERIEAAYALSRDPHMAQKQAFEMSLRKPLPELARYLLAASLTEAIVAEGPRPYVKAVAYSEGWPSWLRLVLLRPIAYAAGRDYGLPADALASLRRDKDPIIVLWADFAQSADAAPSNAESAQAHQHLEQVADGNSAEQPLAVLLLDAEQARSNSRKAILDRATAWTREHHPETAALWDGWEKRSGRIIRRPASKLQLQESIRSGASPRTLPFTSPWSGSDESFPLATSGDDDPRRRRDRLGRGRCRAG